MNSPRLSVFVQFQTVLCAFKSVPMIISQSPRFRMSSLNSDGKSRMSLSKYILTRYVRRLLNFAWQTTISQLQYCGHLHDVIPLVTRAALPYFSAKQLKISPGMLDNLLAVVTFGGSCEENDVDTLRVNVFVCNVSKETQQAWFRTSHVHLQTLYIARSSGTCIIGNISSNLNLNIK